MNIEALNIKGVCLIQNDIFIDLRGAFKEVWEHSALNLTGISFTPDSSCFSYNEKKGTLRGMHYQRQPFAQSKLVSCVHGKAVDIVVDLREDSPTYLKWQSVELSSDYGSSLYIPAGCAHGFMTLTPNTIISYLIEGKYVPEAASVLRWNDPLIDIEWPAISPILSTKDQEAPDFKNE